MLILVGLALITGVWGELLNWLRADRRPGSSADMSDARAAFWRWLTSMRTALILLAAARRGGRTGVGLAAAQREHRERQRLPARPTPTSGRWLDRLWVFDVYASPWFSAIYLLLFVSLVGCLVPRLRQHAANIVAKPPDAPARLDRLPHSAQRVRDRRSGDAAAGHPRRACAASGGARCVREQPDGTVTVAAEKGYLKETGNLVFHFALLALLIGVALGLVVRLARQPAGGGRRRAGFCNTVQQYDEYGLGARTSAADLPPFCVHAERLPRRVPRQRTAGRSTPPTCPMWRVCRRRRAAWTGCGSTTRCGWTARTSTCSATGTRRCCGTPTGTARSTTTVVPFLPDDGMLTSSGVAKFPDANVDPAARRRDDPPTRSAFAGVYLPTVPADPSAAPVGLPGRA